MTRALIYVGLVHVKAPSKSRLLCYFHPIPFLIFDDQISGLDRVKFYKSPFVVIKLYHLTAAETDLTCPTHITPQLCRNGSSPATLFSGLTLLVTGRPTLSSGELWNWTTTCEGKAEFTLAYSICCSCYGYCEDPVR